jgi:hypothetical protein
MKAPCGVLAVALLLVGMMSCGKVPIHAVGAGFVLADASWFADEETLFIFYDVEAEQGLGDPSVIEVTYTTDDVQIPWTPVSELSTVHTHLDVDCGVNAMCGSTSLHVPLEPRDVGIRLRYHRDGQLSLTANPVFNVVGTGDPHAQRSLVVYGVFEEANRRIQWRGRHQFPTLRNLRAQRLGLRREVTISERRYGFAPLASEDNPYSYGVACPAGFEAADLADLVFQSRAAFDATALPFEASEASTVCVDATVIDGTGTFQTGAVARKNPEVRSAFPVLRSPVRDATPIPFFLGPCDRVISTEHEEMLAQRLLLNGVPTTCVDNWEAVGFVDALVVALRDAVEAERPFGNDMVLAIALNQDEEGLSEAVEEALAQIVPAERHRNSPRLAGAFVLDSTDYGLTVPELATTTLWCPATLSFEDIPTVAARSCPTLPDDLETELGPFTFGALPILPTRDQYLDFIDTFSKAQAGEVTALAYRTPEFAATADHVDIGTFGVATFLNGENIGADPDDAFSYCSPEVPSLFVVRSRWMSSPLVRGALVQACAYGLVPFELCSVIDVGLLPIEWLPDWHNLLPEDTYDVGIFWEFPFLLRMEYQALLAGSVSALGFSVPFGIASPEESYYGTEVWLNEAFELEPELSQCRRYCDHPTFDSAGVYQVTAPFRSTYAHSCYVPDFPEPGDSGFPLDP